jgi:PIN domain nuclease of toxin-antitoxin system
VGGQRFEATFSGGCLGNSARAPRRGVAVSAITVWELAPLVARGKVQVYGSVETSLRLLLEDVTILPITPEIAALATQFPDDYPRDLSDRLMGATAREDGMMLVTRDQRIADAGDAGEGARATLNR